MAAKTLVWSVSPWPSAHSESEDQEVIQEGSGGYTTRISRLYYKDQEGMFSDAVIVPLQIFVGLLGIGKSGDWQKEHS